MGRMVNPRQWDFNLGINLRRWLCCAKKSRIRKLSRRRRRRHIRIRIRRRRCSRSRKRIRCHREALSPPSGLVITLLQRFDGRSGRGDQNAVCFLRAAQPGDFPHANLGPLAAVQRAV